jgi:hypothetical protein
MSKPETARQHAVDARQPTTAQLAFSEALFDAPSLPAGVDGRYRAAIRWKRWAVEYAKAPRAKARPDLVAAAASLAVAREALDASIAAGKLADAGELVRVGRLHLQTLTALGLAGKAAEPAKPDPAQEAMERVRKWREAQARK